jgi:uncharacterized membrane protein
VVWAAFISRTRDDLARRAQTCRTKTKDDTLAALGIAARVQATPRRAGCLDLAARSVFAPVPGGSVLAMLSPAEAQKDDIPDLSAAELGAVAHLYRGEIYRSTIWRTRLDNTTNWSIVTMGIALSTTFSSKEASGLPLILIGMLLAVFLGLEARRYRFFNVWRARARYMEKHLYAPILTGKRAVDDSRWRAVLAEDYLHPRHHISFFRAAGRRVRRTYIWIIVIQTTAYFGKLAIHPQMATQLSEFVDRAEIGPIPGWVVLCCGLIYNLGWVFLAISTYWLDRRAHGSRTSAEAMG